MFKPTKFYYISDLSNQDDEHIESFGKFLHLARLRTLLRQWEHCWDLSRWWQRNDAHTVAVGWHHEVRFDERKSATSNLSQHSKHWRHRTWAITCIIADRIVSKISKPKLLKLRWNRLWLSNFNTRIDWQVDQGLLWVAPSCLGLYKSSWRECKLEYWNFDSQHHISW